ncbi:hypothetical protein D9M68_773800 [compost metagenome]
MENEPCTMPTWKGDRARSAATNWLTAAKPYQSPARNSWAAMPITRLMVFQRPRRVLSAADNDEHLREAGSRESKMAEVIVCVPSAG